LNIIKYIYVAITNIEVNILKILSLNKLLMNLFVKYLLQ
jgi:hypothetical protein